MNHIINYQRCLGLVAFMGILSYTSVAHCVEDVSAVLSPDVSGESFLAKPTLQQKKKISVYDVARAARDLNKETAGMMKDVAEVNECAGDCASDIFEGPLARAKRETLRNIHDEVTRLTAHVRQERAHLKKTVGQLRKICSVK